MRYIGTLELADALLNLIFSSQRLIVSGIGISAVGVARIIVIGRHKGQARTRCCIRNSCRCASVPYRMLALRLGQGLAAVNANNFVCAWDTQRRTRSQDIDVAAERGRVRLENRQHRLVHGQTAVGSHSCGYAPQCFAARHGVITAGRGVIRRYIGRYIERYIAFLLRFWPRLFASRCRLRRWSWLRSSALRCGRRTSDLATIRRRGTTRGLHCWCDFSCRWCKCRRIQEYCVLTQ